jgi:enamine deaminase RidA (YjgF/YER057c/UK114 family)
MIMQQLLKTQHRKTQISFHISDAGDGQAFFVASVKDETGAAYAAAAAYSLIAEALKERQMEVVHERVFGSLEVEHIVKTVRKTIFQKHGIPHDTPVTYIQGNPACGKGFAGVLIRAIACRERDDCVWTIKENDIPVGRGWQRKGSRFLVLQNVHGLREDASFICERTLQAQRMFENADQVLQKQGASYHDVLRTWIYISNIDEWYRKFNHARNYTYDRFGVMPSPDNNSILPASTGIEGRTSSGAACTMDIITAGGSLATRPFIKRLSNPSQAEAFHYYSAFSRGVLIEEPDVLLIQVSGTAAIDERGASLFPDDIHNQIACTLEKIESLISPEGASLKDICAATVFVRRPEYAKVFDEVAASRGLKELPHVCVVADICREELLFEMDAEVAINNKRVQGFEDSSVKESSERKRASQN